MRRRSCDVFEIGEEQILDDGEPELLTQQPRPGEPADERRAPAASLEPPELARAPAAFVVEEPEREPEASIEESVGDSGSLTDLFGVGQGEHVEASISEPPGAVTNGARPSRLGLALVGSGARSAALAGGLAAVVALVVVADQGAPSATPRQPSSAQVDSPARISVSPVTRRSRRRRQHHRLVRAAVTRRRNAHEHRARSARTTPHDRAHRRSHRSASRPAAPVAPAGREPVAPGPVAVAPAAAPAVAAPAYPSGDSSAPATSADVGREFGP